jgi:tripartite-type tricarboxylate transporter receptor subunit TctC
VRYVVPFGAGPTEVQARWLAAKLGDAWRQPVIVENHSGASGMAGTRLVAQAAPDGYTLLAANPGPLTVGPNLRDGIGYDPVGDFSPVVLMVTVSSVIAAHPDVPVKNIGELLELARKSPGRLRYGSAGAGTVSHLAMELFNHLSGTRMTHVPRQGLEEAVPELISGQFELLVLPVPEARPLARDGRIRALAATKRTRSALWPELPTVEEAGVRGFESFNWNGVAAPARTPPQIVYKINNTINKLLENTEGRDFFGAKGYEIAGGTPEVFGAFIRAEKEKWGKVARLARIGTRTYLKNPEQMNTDKRQENRQDLHDLQD